MTKEERLLDETSDMPEELRRMLDAARADVPDAARLARIEARLPGGGGGTGGSGGHGFGGGLAVKLGALAVGGALVVGAFFAATRGRGAEGQDAGVTASPEGSAREEIRRDGERDPEPGQGTEQEPEHESRRDFVDRSAGTGRAPDAKRAVTSAPSQQKGDASVPGSGSGLNEVQLLQKALDVLHADPGRALAMTTEHARRFPGGALAQERELLAIEALVRLGRLDEARDRATAFRAQFPSSSHRSRVDALVGSDVTKASEKEAAPTTE